jgi:hypothetical protein
LPCSMVGERAGMRMSVGILKFSQASGQGVS